VTLWTGDMKWLKALCVGVRRFVGLLLTLTSRVRYRFGDNPAIRVNGDARRIRNHLDWVF
jgi:hypothetical protein